MLRLAIRRATTSRTCVPLTYRRCMATVIPEQTLLDSSTPTARLGSSTSPTVQNQALRPHLNIPVREDHGLYNFFRKIPDEDSVKGYKYVTYEHMNERDHGLSRSWTTAELRRKSFRDLHIIWYLCRKEINLLATQKAELRRLHRLAHVSSTPISLRARMCRKTCARIKFVLNERRLALLNATAQVQWIYRPGYKDPAKKPKTKLERGAKMSEQEMKLRMQKLAKKTKLRLLHPELRKRPMMMLRWAPRRGLANPIRPESDTPIS